jgi:methyl-accepting chemotaxis protein
MALALSFRQKLIAPTLVGVAAMLVAIAVSYRLTSRAAAELDRVEGSHLPALRLAQELEAGLQARQRLLQDAASAEEASLLDLADEQHAELLEKLAQVPAEVLAPERAQALVGALEGYHAVSREATEGLIEQRRTDRQAAALGEMADAYNELADGLAEDTAAARKAVAEGLEQARVLQRRSIQLAALMLGGAALAALLVAFLLARTITRPVHALNRAALRIAEGDLTEEIEVGGKDEVAMLASSFGRMTARLRALVATLKDASVALASAAARLSENTRAQVGIVERAATGVSETGVTTRELEHTAALAASRAAAVLEVAKRAGEVSEAGHAAAEGSAEGIRAIQASVQRIAEGSARLLEQARVAGDVVETVRDLAAQSHVLSLNASLEAARAGEAGKGFAVVAAEVRALADQSGKGADRIAKIVRDIQAAIQSTLDQTTAGAESVEASAARIRASGDSLRDLGGIVNETSGAAREIAGAVQQQSTGIAQIATAMRDIDGGMAETVNRLDAVQASADELEETARRIAAIAAEFRLERAET